MTKATQVIQQTETYGAHNYHPLPVVIERAEGVWVWDTEGKTFMDLLSAYSALSHGHRHPRLIEALIAQAQKVTLTSRAFHNDQLGELYKRLVELTKLPRVLPMNTGAEAVETAIKAVRRWGEEVKGVPAGQGEIIVCANNFHGRTTTIISFSSEKEYKRGFGPFTPGFSIIPYGDADALQQAITSNTVGFLVEPIQGEAGIIVPPEGYLGQVAALCKEHRVALMADEIQVGFGRTGKMFCCDHDDVTPDLYILGKALGGGVLPVSAVCGKEEILGVFEPGSHGSTFGGNPLAAAVACAALDVLVDERLTENAAEQGAYLMEKLRAVDSPHVDHVRGRGLLIGVVLKDSAGGARRFCEALMQDGLLCKETHENVIRIAPPLTITREELDWAHARVAKALMMA